MAKAATKAVRAERNIAPALPAMLTHAEFGIRWQAKLVRLGSVDVVLESARVQDLLDRDLREDLQVHQRQEIRLVVLVLADLRVVVDGQLHVREVIDGRGRVKVHNVATDAVLCDFTPSESLVEMALLLSPLREHLVVDWAR